MISRTLHCAFLLLLLPGITAGAAELPDPVIIHQPENRVRDVQFAETANSRLIVWSDETRTHFSGMWLNADYEAVSAPFTVIEPGLFPLGYAGDYVGIAPVATVSVAASTTADEFLVTWIAGLHNDSDDPPLEPGLEMLSRRITRNANGQPIPGSVYRVSRIDADDPDFMEGAGASNVDRLAVAHDRESGNFVVIYPGRLQDPNVDDDIVNLYAMYATVVRPSGEPVVPNSIALTDEQYQDVHWQPSLVYDDVRERFLLAYADVLRHEMHGRSIDIADDGFTLLVGDPALLATATTASTPPFVIKNVTSPAWYFDAPRDRFMLVYADDSRDKISMRWFSPELEALSDVFILESYHNVSYPELAKSSDDVVVVQYIETSFNGVHQFVLDATTAVDVAPEIGPLDEANLSVKLANLRDAPELSGAPYWPPHALAVRGDGALLGLFGLTYLTPVNGFDGDYIFMQPRFIRRDIDLAIEILDVPVEIIGGEDIAFDARITNVSGDAELTRLASAQPVVGWELPAGVKMDTHENCDALEEDNACTLPATIAPHGSDTVRFVLDGSALRCIVENRTITVALQASGPGTDPIQDNNATAATISVLAPAVRGEDCDDDDVQPVEPPDDEEPIDEPVGEGPANEEPVDEEGSGGGSLGWLGLAALAVLRRRMH